MTKITIDDVTEADIHYLKTGQKTSDIDNKIIKAYEAEKNKIEKGQWIVFKHSRVVREWMGDLKEIYDSKQRAVKLSQPLQDLLNKEIG